MARAEGDYNWAKRSRGSAIVQLSGIIAIPIADESEDSFDALRGTGDPLRRPERRRYRHQPAELGGAYRAHEDAYHIDFDDIQSAAPVVFGKI